MCMIAKNLSFSFLTYLLMYLGNDIDKDQNALRKKVMIKTKTPNEIQRSRANIKLAP